MIDAYATETHFLDHLAPVWDALDQPGTLHVDRTLKGKATRLGFTPDTNPLTPGETPVLVASWGDLKRARKHRPVIYMEHGAGQSYTGTRCGSYIGGNRDGVIAALVPNEPAAARHRAAHPTIPVHVVGCPKLDALHQTPAPTDGVVALSHHWDCRVVPETRSTHRHYRTAYKTLADTFPTIGHAHPRAYGKIERDYRAAGLTPVPTFAEVVETASVYVCDNSSTLFEFAALDRPVVVLNAPWYRRDVNHGGRFWDWADIGVQVEHPADLNDAVTEALADRNPGRRREIVAEVYPHLGSATDRAVQAIRSTVEGSA